MIKFDLNFGLDKRRKIIISSGILSLGLLSTRFVPIYLTNHFILGLTVLSYILTLWSLWEGMDKVKAAISMILPTFFTLAVVSFYFLLPIRFLTGFPVAFLFGVTFYTLLLSQNVFNVASMRTIPLYRAASTTVFVLTLLTAFLLFNVMFSFKMFFVWNGVWAFLISLPLILHVLWSIEMDKVSSLVITYSLLLSLVLGEAALALSFWPLFNTSNNMASLMIATVLFVILGISTHALRDRLGRGVAWEYAVWGVAVFFIAVMTTSWTG